MQEKVVRRMREVVVWGLSAGLPIHALCHFSPNEHSSGISTGGLRVLSLPVGLVEGTNLLDGWGLISAVIGTDTASSEFLPEANGDETLPARESPPDQPFPVQLYGQLVEGNSRMYCFLDTRSRRWLRLSPGEEDQPSGIRLVTGPEGEVLLLDLSSGRQFRPVEGRRLLAPVPSGEAGREED